MARLKRIFIGFAMEDQSCFVLLSGQGKNSATPFEFINMGVKQPWDSQWKTNCRTRIKGCDGMIALISKNTASADGAMWEIKCALEEQIPIIGLYTSTNNRPTLFLNRFNGVAVKDWTWANISAFIDRV